MIFTFFTFYLNSTIIYQKALDLYKVDFIPNHLSRKSIFF